MAYVKLKDKNGAFITYEEIDTISIPLAYESGEAQFVDASSATATENDIVKPKTAFTNTGKVTGTIETRSAEDVTSDNGIVHIPVGYYPVAVDKRGDPSGDATATADDILAPKTAYARGKKLTGTMSTNMLPTSAISGLAFEETTGDYGWKTTVDIQAGYYPALTVEKTFSDVFPAPATEGTSIDLRLGKQLYNHEGKLITGTMTEKSAATYTAATHDQTISGSQYLTGTQTIKAVRLSANPAKILVGETVKMLSNGIDVGSIAGTLANYNNTYTEIVEQEPLCFTALQANSTVQLTLHYTPRISRNFEYSTDKTTWTAFSLSAGGDASPVITLTDIGDKVYFRGTNATLGEDYDILPIYCQFVMEGRIAASGNCNSLLDYLSPTNTIPRCCFYSLFDHCTALTSMPELPATTVNGYGYSNMFKDCSALTTASNLPATTIGESGYAFMFMNCVTLVTAPTMAATNLNLASCTCMFNGCTLLENCSIPPATTLARRCYVQMFYNCTSLTTPPALPATTLDSFCYANMFNGCTSLTKVPKLNCTTLQLGCYQSMFNNCTSLYVSDTLVSGTAELAWTIPTTGTFTNTYALSNMFAGCQGTRSSDDMPGNSSSSYTYYTQNMPV